MKVGAPPSPKGPPATLCALASLCVLLYTCTLCSCILVYLSCTAGNLAGFRAPYDANKLSLLRTLCAHCFRENEEAQVRALQFKHRVVHTLYRRYPGPVLMRSPSFAVLDLVIHCIEVYSVILLKNQIILLSVDVCSDYPLHSSSSE